MSRDQAQQTQAGRGAEPAAPSPPEGRSVVVVVDAGSVPEAMGAPGTDRSVLIVVALVVIVVVVPIPTSV